MNVVPVDSQVAEKRRIPSRAGYAGGRQPGAARRLFGVADHQNGGVSQPRRSLPDRRLPERRARIEGNGEVAAKQARTRGETHDSIYLNVRDS